MSNISDLIKLADSNNLNVSVTVSLSDLRQFLVGLVDDAEVTREDAEKARKQTELLRPSEVSEILKVSRPTLERWKKSGYLMPIKIGGKCFYNSITIYELQKEQK
ncbi:helix-turn-helix domain-containing protein [bacterium]|jgi:hypothetical protein|nr:helix-turn-helix domain-containing protein [bacterium]